MIGVGAALNLNVNNGLVWLVNVHDQAVVEGVFVRIFEILRWAILEYLKTPKGSAFFMEIHFVISSTVTKELSVHLASVTGGIGLFALTCNHEYVRGVLACQDFWLSSTTST
jgi:hypothetical protein